MGIMPEKTGMLQRTRPFPKAAARAGISINGARRRQWRTLKNAKQVFFLSGV